MRDSEASPEPKLQNLNATMNGSVDGSIFSKQKKSIKRYSKQVRPLDEFGYKTHHISSDYHIVKGKFGFDRASFSVEKNDDIHN